MEAVSPSSFSDGGGGGGGGGGGDGQRRTDGFTVRRLPSNSVFPGASCVLICSRGGDWWACT